MHETISLGHYFAPERRRTAWSKTLTRPGTTLLQPSQVTEAAGAGASSRARTWTLTVACIAVSLVVASMTALNTTLGDIAVATSAAQTQLTWIVDGYTLALACLLLPAGAIGDRYGRRGALLAGLTIFSLASVAPALLHSPTQIIAGRAMAGVGAAFVMPATLSLLTVAYTESAAH
nr:MFS transporter [Mycobacterium vicinigordonae]